MIKIRRRKNQTKKLDGTHFMLYTIDKKPADTAPPEGRWEKGVPHESPPVHLLELAQKSGYWFLYLLYAVPVRVCPGGGTGLGPAPADDCAAAGPASGEQRRRGVPLRPLPGRSAGPHAGGGYVRAPVGYGGYSLPGHHLSDSPPVAVAGGGFPHLKL